MKTLILLIVITILISCSSEQNNEQSLMSQGYSEPEISIGWVSFDITKSDLQTMSYIQKLKSNKVCERGSAIAYFTGAFNYGNKIDKEIVLITYLSLLHLDNAINSWPIVISVSKGLWILDFNNTKLNYESIKIFDILKQSKYYSDTTTNIKKYVDETLKKLNR